MPARVRYGVRRRGRTKVARLTYQPYNQSRKFGNMSISKSWIARQNNAALGTHSKSTGFADSMYVKLVYTTVASVTSTLGTDAFYLWALNDVFDPDVTSAGNQSVAFDNWAAMYTRYRVIGCKYDIRVSNNASTPLLTAFGAMPTTASGPSTARIATETKHFKWQNRNCNDTPTVYKGYFKPWNIIGVKKQTYMDDDEFQSAVTASPARRIGMELFVVAADAATTVTAQVVAQFTHYVKFSQPVILGQS